MLVLLLLALNASHALAQTIPPTNVDVSMANQTFEGWGASLAWVANSVGGWGNKSNQSGSGATNEHWNVIPVSGGVYRIVNENSGLDLELNGTFGTLDQWQDVPGSSNEHWILSIAN